MLFRRQPDKPAEPRHLEIWGQLDKQNRFFRRLASWCVLLAFLGMAGGAYGTLVALHEPLVFHVDPSGYATSVGRRGQLHGPADVEVRFVAKQFLRRTLGYHSETIESDLADAFNLMTDELRQHRAAELDTYLANKGQSFVAFVRAQQLRIDVQFKSLEVADHAGKRWTVKVRGRVTAWPLNRVGDAAARVRGFEANLTLARVPRTEVTPNALLVSAQTVTFYEHDSATKVQEDRVGGGTQ